jgi:hypothetical protein
MPGAAMLSRLHPAGFVEPCLPTPARAVPTGPQWAHEIKHDGFRFIARRDGDRVRVFSRRGKDWSDKVPTIVQAMLALPVLLGARAEVYLFPAAVLVPNLRAGFLSGFVTLFVLRAFAGSPERKSAEVDAAPGIEP